MWRDVSVSAYFFPLNPGRTPWLTAKHREYFGGDSTITLAAEEEEEEEEDEGGQFCRCCFGWACVVPCVVPWCSGCWRCVVFVSPNETDLFKVVPASVVDRLPSGPRETCGMCSL